MVTEATGESKVDDPARLKTITAISVDKHTWKRGHGRRTTQYATGIVDLPQAADAIADLTKGCSGTVLADWLARGEDWKARIVTAMLDPLRGYLTTLGNQLTQS